MSSLGTLAATAPEAFDPVSLIQTLGLPMAFVVLFLTGKIVTGSAYKEMREDRDREREARLEIQKKVTDEIAPAMVRSTDALLEYNARRRSGGE